MTWKTYHVNPEPTWMLFYFILFLLCLYSCFLMSCSRPNLAKLKSQWKMLHSASVLDWCGNAILRGVKCIQNNTIHHHIIIYIQKRIYTTNNIFIKQSIHQTIYKSKRTGSVPSRALGRRLHVIHHWCMAKQIPPILLLLDLFFHWCKEWHFYKTKKQLKK